MPRSAPRLVNLADAKAGSITRQELAYGLLDDAQTLDLYRIAGSGLCKLVVFAHGGGWRHGSKAGGRRVAQSLAALGYAVASVNYRMLPNFTVMDAATDVAASIAFLLANAGAHGLHPENCALIGHSAGGHLVALVATDSRYAAAVGLDLSRIAAVIALDGVFDLERRLYDRLMNSMDNATRRMTSPLMQTHLLAIHPRFCLIYTDGEKRFRLDADAYAAALQARGEVVVLHHVPELSHSGLMLEFDNAAYPMAGCVTACLQGAFAGD